MQSISTAVPKADVRILPRPTHVGDQEDRRAAVSHGPRLEGPCTPQEPEAYQADRTLHALFARSTGGLSPIALWLAYADWVSHLATAPQRRMEIFSDALRNANRFFGAALNYFSPGQGPWSLIKPQPQDRRFAAPEWETPPFNLLAQGFLLAEQGWHNATTGVRGVEAERGDRRIRGPADARCAGAVQFRRDQS